MQIVLSSQGQIVRVQAPTWLIVGVGANPRYGATVESARLGDKPEGDQHIIDWQLELGLNDEEQHQRISEIKDWEDWLANVDGDLECEPPRRTGFPDIKPHRTDPVGLGFLVSAFK